jgi:circadian clock protein KaiC
MSVVKQRSRDHETTIREFRIGQGGIRVGEPLREFQGVLLGVPTFTGGATALRRNEDGDAA